MRCEPDRLSHQLHQEVASCDRTHRGHGWLNRHVLSISRVAIPDKRTRGPSTHQRGPSPSQTGTGVQVNVSLLGL
jgi:hypothetical protein